jgi:formylglycine-generating enzyme required for sulfatase activity
MSMLVSSEIPREIHRARTLTDNLFAQVLPEALYDRPIRERHRLVFYIGHLEAFDWNLIGKSLLRMSEINKKLDALFAFGIDPTENNLPNDRISDWPELFEVRRYVADARHAVDRVIAQVPEKVLRMVLEHRLMHAETLTYLIHNLPYSGRLTRMRRIPTEETPVSQQFLKIPTGSATLGLPRSNGFGWDNEFDLHSRQVESFAINRFKVTNSQYLEFVREGGPAPHYWIQRHGEWRYRGFHGEIPLPVNYPVYVSYKQADAFARWAGKELPTEAQFHRAAFGSSSGVERQYPWVEEHSTDHHGNFDFSNSDVVSVTESAAGDSAFGVSQLVGNGWEWTSTKFGPFEGFKADPLYAGYSADFFDGEHHVAKGASCVTDRLLIRRSFRNWFRDSYPYAYTTFRLVEN